jgi:hypothetical protein
LENLKEAKQVLKTEVGDESGKSNINSSKSSQQGTMSAETRATLPDALKEIFARLCRYYA